VRDVPLRDLLYELRGERNDTRAAMLMQEVERRVAGREPRECSWCGETFTPTRSDQRYCATRCRVAAHRSRA
jgi:hypothetical protein